MSHEEISEVSDEEYMQAEINRLAIQNLHVIQELETLVKVPGISMLEPRDIALSALVARSHGELAALATPKPEYLNTLMQKNFPSAPPLVASSIKTEYRDLIGQTNYAHGKVAKALGSLERRFSPDRVQELDDLLARFTAFFLAFEGNETHAQFPQPGIRLTNGGDGLQSPLGQIHALSKVPEVVLEYGPGIAGIQRLQSGEITGDAATRWVMIDQNRYTSSLIDYYSRYKGASAPKVVSKNATIAEATSAIRTVRPEGNVVDLIIASMTYSAGAKELEKGIANGHHLLRPGGTMAILEPNQASGKEASARQLLPILERYFKKKPSVQERHTASPDSKGQRKQLVYTVFEK
jgi:hypothetical protein